MALQKSYDHILTTQLSADAVSLYEVDLTKSTALIFKNGHAGVSQEIGGLGDGNFIISQVGMIWSLNKSVACTVSLYEAFRQKTEAGHYNNHKLQPAHYYPLPAQ